MDELRATPVAVRLCLRAESRRSTRDLSQPETNPTTSRLGENSPYKTPCPTTATRKA
ncbi:MAG: hypothetical protein KDA86_19510 [Planctomycetaceae bacterium]|nr:hypothetical protein [Planctomycetaceae bacterium]